MKHALPEWRPVLKTALPLVLSNCVNAAQNMLSIFLAATISLSAAASAGYINRIYFIYGAMIIAMNGAGSIRLNRLNGDNQRAAFDAMLKRMVRFSVLGAVACFVMFFLGAHSITRLVEPNGDVDAVPTYLRWMAISYIAVTLASPYYMALIAKKKGHDIFRALLVSLSLGGAFSAVSVLYFKLDLAYVGAGCALAQLLYLALMIRAYKRLVACATVTAHHAPGIQPTFQNSFSADAFNLFMAMSVSTLVDFLILYVLVEDVQFVALMSFYFSTTAMLQGVSLGFATAASVFIAQAINESRRTYSVTVTGYLLYSLPLALFCAGVCYAYLYHALQPTSPPSGVIFLISLITLISCITLFAQRAVLRAKGDTTFIKKLTFVLSALIKLPLVFYIAYAQPASAERTSLLFYVFLLCSVIGLVAIGLRISKSFKSDESLPASPPVGSASCEGSLK